MTTVTIRQAGSEPVQAPLPNGAYLIGAGQDCHIQLDKPDVSRRHAQLVISDTAVNIMDLGSSNGTFIGKSPDAILSNRMYPVASGERIRIGKYVQIILEREENAPPTIVRQEDMLKVEKGEIPVLNVSGVPENMRPIVQEIKRQAHKELLIRLNLKKMALSGISEEELNNQARNMIREILSQLNIKLPAGLSREIIEKELVQEAIGLGPLEYLIARDDITEIMVNGPNKVYVEHKGEIYRTDAAFADDNQVLASIERIVAPLGRRIDESSPMVDARLADGSRVNAIIPPLSLV